MDSAIKSGKIPPVPYKYRSDKSPCADCVYSPMCAFFGGKRSVREKKGKKGEIWDEMAKRGGGE